jgi:hypothetical protein
MSQSTDSGEPQHDAPLYHDGYTPHDDDATRQSDPAH